MRPHKQGIVDEESDLDEKLEELNQSIASNPIFGRLNQAYRKLLTDQRDALGQYSDIGATHPAVCRVT
jgi:hypothetical protein